MNEKKVMACVLSEMEVERDRLGKLKRGVGERDTSELTHRKSVNTWRNLGGRDFWIRTGADRQE